MLADLVAQRYSRALLRACGTGTALREVAPQAAALKAAAEREGIASFLGDPVVDGKDKLAALEEAFGGGLHPLMRSFLAAVVGNKRGRFLGRILEEFGRLVDEAEGRLRAELRSARSLKPEELKLLGAELGRRTGREVVLTAVREPGLIGGAVLRIGDRVHDGSVRGALERLRVALKAPAPPRRAAPAETKSVAKGGAKSVAKGGAKSVAKGGAKAAAKGGAKAAAKGGTKAAAKGGAKAPSRPSAASGRTRNPRKRGDS